MIKRTIAEIKVILPIIRMLWEDRIYLAKISGTKNKFASVIPMWTSDGKNKIMTTSEFEFSWKSIKKAYNNGTFLII